MGRNKIVGYGCETACLERAHPCLTSKIVKWLVVMSSESG